MLQEALDLGERGMGTAVRAKSLQSVQRARQGEPEAARHLLSVAQEQAAEQGGIVQWEPVSVVGGGQPGHGRRAAGRRRWPPLRLRSIRWAGKLRWRRARTLIDWAGAHLARGESGDRERAEELLREAEAEFEAMGAHGYVERVKGRLEELGAGSSTV